MEAKGQPWGLVPFLFSGHIIKNNQDQPTQVRVAALLAVEELCGDERSRTRKAQFTEGLGDCWAAVRRTNQ